MNYKRATIAAGASVVSLVAIVVAVGVCVVVTFDFDFFGGGLSTGERLLWLTLPSVAAGVGVAFTTWTLCGEWLRTTVPAIAAGIAANNLAHRQISHTSDTGIEPVSAVTLASTLLAISAFSVLIATVRRTGIPRSRAKIVIILVAAFVGVAVSVLLVVDGGTSFFVSLIVWIVLPALAALLIPPSLNET